MTINEKLFHSIKPLLIGLSFSSGVLCVLLGNLAWKHYQSHMIISRAQAENEELIQKIDDIKALKSAAVASKLEQLAQSESTIRSLQNYLRGRGIPVKTTFPDPNKNKQSRTENAGGPEYPFEEGTLYSEEFNQHLQDLLNTAMYVPLGRPAQGGITSRFGFRSNPFTGRGSEFHSGLDFRGKIGEPVKVTANGVVEFAGSMNGYGNVVRVRHKYGYATLYGHLSAIDVKTGQAVKAGELIGKIGSTGRSTGPHLHYEVRLKNTPINPEQFLSLAD